MSKKSVEDIKQDSNYLRGGLKEALQEDSTHFSEENIQVLKFHGSYQQDDRDLRKQLRKEGKERAYSMMIRARIPGGVMTPEQYLQFDKLSDDYGNHTMRITTRQTFQLHGILKSNLKNTIRSINDVLITTLGGCGDQVRNTVGCAEPHEGPFYDAVREDMLAIVERTSAQTNAYHEIWLDGEKVNLDGKQDEEPIYKEVYLPRKFKIAFAYEGDNCADIYSNDIAVVAHRSGDKVEGYTILVGGGMGRTVTDSKTQPYVAKPLAFVTREELVDLCVAVLKVQRDYGNREERRFARMKYLIDDRGMEWFEEKVTEYFGKTLAAPRELKWESSHDHLGWHPQDGDKGYLGLFIQNGRIHDTEKLQLKSALRIIVEKYQPMVHLTTQQNVILAGITPKQYDEIAGILQNAGLPLPENWSNVEINSMACVALPTCGLAIAESERVLPEVLPEIDDVMQDLGLGDQDMIIRMTGCPNGCARPYLAEVGFVGRAIGRYDMFLGASPVGTRTNTLFKEMVVFDDIVPTLRPLLTDYATNRETNEAFGDYCHRVGFDHLRELEQV